MYRNVLGKELGIVDAVRAKRPARPPVVLARAKVRRLFAPLDGVSRVTLSGAGFVQPGDMVMGIVSNGVAMAYPVNQVAYHHVVNDTVGGVPIAATY